MFQGMTLLLSIDEDCEHFARQVADQLNRSGLQVVRSFDLQEARAAHQEYACPYHDAGACTCQLIVLLVYSRSGFPATLVIHGHDGQTRVFLVDRPGQQFDVFQEMPVLRRLKSGDFYYGVKEQ